MITQAAGQAGKSGQLATFIQHFVYWPDRGHHSAVLTTHPANGGQQSQLAVDGLQVAMVPKPGDRHLKFYEARDNLSGNA